MSFRLLQARARAVAERCAVDAVVAWHAPLRDRREVSSLPRDAASNAEWAAFYSAYARSRA